MPDLRLAGAILAGKAVAGASRRLRLGGGTTLPGDVSRAIDPEVLSKLAAGPRRGVVLVTGTNGKTSTAALVRRMAIAAGLAVGGNTSGSNLIFGLTATALEHSDPRGRTDLDWLVFEVDELSAPRAVRETHPAVLLVLNAFRDQLDRSFEVDAISSRLAEAVRSLPESATAVLNADDPRIAGLSGLHSPNRCFGIDDPALNRRTLPPGADVPACPRCGATLHAEQVFYSHCGRYRCRGCGWASPTPTTRAGSVKPEGLDALHLLIETEGARPLSCRVELAGIHNAANIAAAVATAQSMDIPEEAIAAGLAAFRPAFGRSQLSTWAGTQVRLLLAKNPAGLQENLEALLALDRSPVVAIGLNDGIADGRDISWIWDVELERLATAPYRAVITSGTRAAEMALRLTYGGLAPDRIVVRPRPEAALDTLARLAGPGVPASALLTYTAMLQWHRALVAAGSASPFWAST